MVMSVKSNNFFKYIFHRASKIYLLIFFLMAAMLFSSFCSIEILRRLIELAISPNVNFHDVIKYIALYISVIIFNFAVSMVSEYFSSIAVKNDIIKSQIDSYEKILKRNNLSSLQYSADDAEGSSVKTWYENEDKYYSARNKLKLGVIMGGVSSSIFLGSMITSFADRSSDVRSDIVVITLFTIWCSPPFVVSIPFTIVGAVRMHKYKKYKPTVSVSPSEVKFSINF